MWQFCAESTGLRCNCIAASRSPIGEIVGEKIEKLPIGKHCILPVINRFLELSLSHERGFRGNPERMLQGTLRLHPRLSLVAGAFHGAR